MGLPVFLSARFHVRLPDRDPLFRATRSEFRELGCQVVGASTDSAYSHKAWFEKDLPEVKYPVLADTAHTVSRDYGVLIEDKGIALRGTFLIDPKASFSG